MITYLHIMAKRDVWWLYPQLRRTREVLLPAGRVYGRKAHEDPDPTH